MGKITDYVKVCMTILDHSERATLAVTKIGNPDLFLRLDWLRNHNPNIDWAEAKISFDRCPDACGCTADLKEIEADEPEDLDPSIQLNKDEKLMDRDACVQEGQLAHRLDMVSTGSKDMEVVKEYIKEYKDVFSANEFDQLPQRRPWDHVIEMTPGFKPVDCKVYPLNPQEQKALDEFLEENLRTGRIRPSKSPMASTDP